jgi:hypothetical protein
VKFGMVIDHKGLYIKCEMFISQQLPAWWPCDVIPDKCNICNKYFTKINQTTATNNNNGVTDLVNYKCFQQNIMSSAQN